MLISLNGREELFQSNATVIVNLKRSSPKATVFTLYLLDPARNFLKWWNSQMCFRFRKLHRWAQKRSCATSVCSFVCQTQNIRQNWCLFDETWVSDASLRCRQAFTIALIGPRGNYCSKWIELFVADRARWGHFGGRDDYNLSYQYQFSEGRIF